MKKIIDFGLRFWQPAVNVTAGTGLFPETLISQAALESSWGEDRHGQNDVNNFFGIKANKGWTGKVISSTTSEYIDGKKTIFRGTGEIYPDRETAIKDGANNVTLFRVYPDTAEGLRGWVSFLQSNKRYERAGVFTAESPEKQFEALKRAGYATSPSYVATLIKVLNTFKKYNSELMKKIKAAVSSDTGKAFILILPLFFIGLYLISKK